MKGMEPESKVVIKKKTLSHAAENSQAELELSRGALFAMSAAPVLIGLWAAACLIGGLVASGGPIALLRSWVTAFTGM